MIMPRNRNRVCHQERMHYCRPSAVNSRVTSYKNLLGAIGSFRGLTLELHPLIRDGEQQGLHHLRVIGCEA